MASSHLNPPPDSCSGPAPVSGAAVVAAAGESHALREARLTTFFHAFDTRHTGFVERKEIESGLSRLNVSSKHKYALELLTACDENDDGQFSYDMFQRHMRATEEELFSLLHPVDVNTHACLIPTQLPDSTQPAAGIPVAEKKGLPKKVDGIDTTPEAVSSITSVLASSSSNNSSKSAEAWKYLSAGALAGAVSRTATAPFDRIKVMMQVQAAFDNMPKAPANSASLATHGRTAGVPAAPPGTQVGKGPPVASAPSTGAAQAASKQVLAARAASASWAPRERTAGVPAAPTGTQVGKGPPVASAPSTGAAQAASKQVLAARAALASLATHRRTAGIPAAPTDTQVGKGPHVDSAPSRGAAQEAASQRRSPASTQAAGATSQQALAARAPAGAGSGSMRWAAAAIHKEAGWMGFFRGNGLQVLKMGPETALRFYIYEQMKPALAKSWGHLTGSQVNDEEEVGAGVKFFSGGLAGTLAQTGLYPLEVLKTRIQTHNLCATNTGTAAASASTTLRSLVPADVGPALREHPHAPTYPHTSPSRQTSAGATHSTGPMSSKTARAFRLHPNLHSSLPLPTSASGPTPSFLPRPRPISPSALFLFILRTEGPAAYYRGLGPSMVGMFPYSGLDLALYETLKSSAASFMLSRQRHMQKAMMGESVAEMDCPFVEVSPLLQLSCGTLSGAVSATLVYPLQVIRTRLQAMPFKTGESGPKLTPWHVSKQIWKGEGLVGFYSGLAPNLLKVAPQAALTFVVYEYVKSMLSIK